MLYLSVKILQFWKFGFLDVTWKNNVYNISSWDPEGKEINDNKIASGKHKLTAGINILVAFWGNPENKDVKYSEEPTRKRHLKIDI